MTTITTAHEFIVTSEDATTRTWKCTCGFWCTVETIDAPEYHTPMADRFAGHLEEVEEIASGRAARDLPRHRVETFHRRSWIKGQPGQFVDRAIWLGGWRDIRTYACHGCWSCQTN